MSKQKLQREANMDFKKLRIALIIYSCMSQKTDLRNISSQDINVNIDDLKKRLIPLLKRSEINEMPSVMLWSDNLLKNCQEAFHHLLPINNQEKEFLSALLDHGIIEPELISNDSALINNIKHHPAIQWRVQNIRKEISKSNTHLT